MADHRDTPEPAAVLDLYRLLTAGLTSEDAAHDKTLLNLPRLTQGESPAAVAKSVLEAVPEQLRTEGKEASPDPGAEEEGDTFFADLRRKLESERTPALTRGDARPAVRVAREIITPALEATA